MADVWVIVLLVILCLIVIVLNSICIYVIVKTPSLHQHSVYAIANLLSIHLLQGLFVIPAYIVKRFEIKQKSISGPVCDWFRLSYMITNYAACLTLLLMTADRLCAIKWPLVYRANATTSKIAVAIAGIWMYVIALCVIPFFNDGPSRSGCHYRPSKEWSIAMLSVNTFLPMILIICFYVVIFVTARYSRHCATIENQTLVAIRIAKISAAVISTFLLCWGPSFVYYFLMSVCPTCFSSSYNNSTTEKTMTFLMKFLTFLDGVFAPVIYCLNHRGFQSGFQSFKKYVTGAFHSQEEREALRSNEDGNIPRTQIEMK